MKVTHNEFMEEVIEESREPTLAEQTHDDLTEKGETALNTWDNPTKDDANYNKKVEVK